MCTMKIKNKNRNKNETEVVSNNLKILLMLLFNLPLKRIAWNVNYSLNHKDGTATIH